jgi:TetR/AcrR family transcriptional repressor of mexJK operon
MPLKRASFAKVNAPLGRPKDTAKRAGIIRAAMALFMKDGFELTSMEAVAKKADVSKLTIYSHFANKEDLFKAAVSQRCDQQAMPECFMALADLPVEKALLQLGHRLATLIFSPDSIRLQRVMQAESGRHPHIIKIFYEAGPRRVREAFAELLEIWNRQGKLDVPDVALATEQFFSLLKGEKLLKTLMHLETRTNPHDMQKHVQAAVQLFLTGYQTKTKLGVS